VDVSGPVKGSNIGSGFDGVAMRVVPAHKRYSIVKEGDKVKLLQIIRGGISQGGDLQWRGD